MAQGPQDLVDPNIAFGDQSFKFLENSILQFYQILFSTFKPGSLHFEPGDSANSDIRIEGRNTDNLEDVDTRPKIVVSRGPVLWQNTGTGGSNFVGSANLSRFERKHTGMNDATIAVSCFSREDLEADRIAQICFDAPMMLKDVLHRFGFLTIQSVQAGQRAKIRSDARPELFVAPVLIQAKVTRNYKVQYTNPVQLRKIMIQFLLAP